MSSSLIVFVSVIVLAASVDVPSSDVLPPFAGSSAVAASPVAAVAPKKPAVVKSVAAKPAFSSFVSTPAKKPTKVAPKTAFQGFGASAPKKPTTFAAAAPSSPPKRNISPIVVRSAHSHSSDDANAQAVRYESNIDHDGTYHFAYETDNGIQADEQGSPQQVGSETAEQVHGSYSYTAPDGQLISVQYVANEAGFQPTGEHIPTPPPIPEAILRAIRYIEEHPSSSS